MAYHVADRCSLNSNSSPSPSPSVSSHTSTSTSSTSSPTNTSTSSPIHSWPSLSSASTSRWNEFDNIDAHSDTDMCDLLCVRPNDRHSYSSNDYHVTSTLHSSSEKS